MRTTAISIIRYVLLGVLCAAPLTAQQINLGTQVRGIASTHNGGVGMDTSAISGCPKLTNGVWAFAMANCTAGTPAATPVVKSNGTALVPATGTDVTTLITSLTNCGQTGYVYSPQANGCVLASGGSVTGTPLHILAINSGGAATTFNATTDSAGNALTVPGILATQAGTAQLVDNCAGNGTLNTCHVDQYAYSKAADPTHPSEGIHSDVIPNYGAGLTNDSATEEYSFHGRVDYDYMAKIGVTQGWNPNFDCEKIGDCGALYGYTTGTWGNAFGGDEGAWGLASQMNESAYDMHGTASAYTSGANSTGQITVVADGTHDLSKGGGTVAGGDPIIDLSGTVYTGALAGTSTGLAGSVIPGAPAGLPLVHYLPLSGTTLPLTTAWAHCDSPELLGTKSALTYVSIANVTCTLNAVGSSTPALTNGVVRVVGANSVSAAIITSAPAPTSGSQVITISLRQSQPNGFVVFQGGLSDGYFNFNGDLATTGLRTSYPALGSLTGTDLIYADNVNGNIYGNELPGGFGTNIVGTGVTIYHGADVIATGCASGNCTHTLEANGINWAGHTIENPHWPNLSMRGIADSCFLATLPNASIENACLSVYEQGTTISGTFRSLHMKNGNPESLYASGTGLTAPVGISIDGPMSYGIRFGISPSPSFEGVAASLIRVANWSANATTQQLDLFDMTAMDSDSRFSWHHDTHHFSFGRPVDLLDALTVTGNTALNGNVITLGTADTTTTANGALVTSSYFIPKGLIYPQGGPMQIYLGGGVPMQVLDNGFNANWVIDQHGNQTTSASGSITNNGSTSLNGVTTVPDNTPNSNNEHAANTKYVDAAIAASGGGSTVPTGSPTATPGAAAGTYSGTTPSPEVAGGNDSGTITFPTGASTGTVGAVLTVAFSATWSTVRSCIIAPYSDNVVGVQVYAASVTTSGWTVRSLAESGLPASSTVAFSYQCK